MQTRSSFIEDPYLWDRGVKILMKIFNQLAKRQQKRDERRHERIEQPVYTPSWVPYMQQGQMQLLQDGLTTTDIFNIAETIVQIHNQPVRVMFQHDVQRRDGSYQPHWYNRIFGSVEELRSAYDEYHAQSSDVKDDILDRSASITMLREDQFESVRLTQMINRAVRGRGEEDVNVDIKIIDDKDYYIPSSGKCLLKCLSYLSGRDRETDLVQWIESHRRVSKKALDWNVECIPQNLVNGICKDLRIESRIYDVKQKKTPNMIFCHAGHYVVLKNPSAQSVLKLDSMITKIERPLQESIEVKPANHDVIYTPIQKQLNSMWIFDLETYPSSTGQLKPYACGLTPLKHYAKYAQSRNNAIDIDMDKRVSQVIANTKDRLVHVFTLDHGNVIHQMLSHLESMHKKTTDQKKKDHVYCYAHNASGFDSYATMFECSQYQVTGICKSGSKILSLEITTGSCIVHLMCTYSHLTMSLGSLCASYRLPESIAKKSCDVASITEQDWNDRRQEWFEYLQFDCISLAVVWSQYVLGIQKMVPDLDIRKCLSSAGLAWKSFLHGHNETLGITELQDHRKVLKKGDAQHKDITDAVDNAVEGSVICQYTDMQAVQVVRKTIHGGRVQACIQRDWSTSDERILSILQDVYGTVDLDMISKMNKSDVGVRHAVWWMMRQIDYKLEDCLVAYDATSLYPSAMHEIDVFPDIRSSVPIGATSYEDMMSRFKHFIVECDIWIPEDLCFIPVCVKMSDTEFIKCTTGGVKEGPAQSGAYYATGHARHQYYNNIDLSELVAVGGRVTAVHRGYGYTASQENPFRPFVKKFFDARQVYKKEGSAVESTCKLILNSAYGKTVQKMIDREISVTTEQQFLAKENDHSVTKAVKLPCGQVLYEKTLSSEQQLDSHMPSILGSYILAVSRRIMNRFVTKIDGWRNRRVYYTDTDSLYIEKQYADLLDNGDALGSGKNDHGDSKGIIRALFLGPKQKIVYTVDTATGEVAKHVTMKGIYGDQQGSITIDMIPTILSEGMKVEQKGALGKSVWQSFVNGGDLAKGSQSTGVFQHDQSRTLKVLSQNVKMVVSETGEYRYRVMRQ